MDNEPNRDLSHDEAAQLLYQDALRAGLRAAREVLLPNGRIADVVVINAKHHVTIYEVKTELKASLVATTFEKYWPFANYLWLAIPNMSAQRVQPLLWQMCDFPSARQVGIVGVYREANAVHRDATWHRIPEVRLINIEPRLDGITR